MVSFTILSEEHITEALEQLPEWRAENNQLKADFTFSDFRTAFAFITLVAIESEKIGHHPEWSNAYNKVSFAFSTHDADNKITDLDIKIATYISKTADSFLRK